MKKGRFRVDRLSLFSFVIFLACYRYYGPFLVGIRTVRPRIRCAERVRSVPVGYDADIIVSVILVMAGGMVSSRTVYPLLLQPMLC